MKNWDGDEEQKHAGRAHGCRPDGLLRRHWNHMIANREHEGKWDPAMGYPLSQPYHLRGVGGSPKNM